MPVSRIADDIDAKAPSVFPWSSHLLGHTSFSSIAVALQALLSALITTMDPLSDPSEDHRNRGSAYLSVSITFCALAFVLVLLRFYTRLTIIHLIGMDDLAVFLAMVSLQR